MSYEIIILCSKGEDTENVSSKEIVTFAEKSTSGQAEITNVIL